jgi:hypothetical protein
MLKSSPVKRIRVIRLLACAPCMHASHVSVDWRSALHDEKPAGKADLRVHGLQVYEARLWRREAAPDRLSPLALGLTYQRKINKETLINASLDEMSQIATAIWSLAGRNASLICRREAWKSYYWPVSAWHRMRFLW